MSPTYRVVPGVNCVPVAAQRTRCTNPEARGEGASGRIAAVVLSRSRSSRSSAAEPAVACVARQRCAEPGKFRLYFMPA